MRCGAGGARSFTATAQRARWGRGARSFAATAQRARWGRGGAQLKPCRRLGEHACVCCMCRDPDASRRRSRREPRRAHRLLEWWGRRRVRLGKGQGVSQMTDGARREGMASEWSCYSHRCRPRQRRGSLQRPLRGAPPSLAQHLPSTPGLPIATAAPPPPPSHVRLAAPRYVSRASSSGEQ